MKLVKLLFKEKTFFKNILITLVASAFIHFLSYLFNIYLARNLAEQDFGFYNAAIGIIYLVQIPTVAIQTAITKKVAQKRGFNLNKFKLESLLQLGAVGIALTLLFILFGKNIADIANIPIQYILPLSIALFGAVVSPLLKGFLLGLEKIPHLNLLMLIETVMKFLMAYYSISKGMDITIPILANVLPSLLTLAVVFPLVKTGSSKVPVKRISIEYKTVVILFLSFLFLNFSFTLDLILVNPQVRASYGALSLIGKIVYFASITIAGVMISKLANQKPKQRKKTLVISLIFTALTGLAISAVFLLFTNQIVDIVFKGMYMEIVPYVVMYCIAMTVYAMTYMVINSLLINESYSHIIFLILLTVLQVALYSINNSSLNDAVVNQMIIYGMMFVFVITTLIFYIFKKDEKDKELVKE
ncbi:MAG: hypothetical protein ACOX0X_00410 [Candidatus Dojkabacteria bacterium]